jgi:REP element-mobilizing transposase RayT
VSYWKLFYHFVWSTRSREALIREDLASDLYGEVVGKATQLGAVAHAVGGVEDHVHLVASVPPRVAVADFIGQIKESSSHFANHMLGLSGTFGWQAEYGVLSFDDKHVAKVVAYVLDQRRNHAEGSMIVELERSGDGRKH